MNTGTIEQRLVKASEFSKTIDTQKGLVEAIIPSNGIIEIVGASASYKTFITLDILFCIATGLPYHGFSTTKGIAIYVCGEATNGIKRRLRGLELHYQVSEYDLYILPMSSNIFCEADVVQLAQNIKDTTDDNVAILILDTLHKNSAGVDENSARDFTTILQNIEKHLKSIVNVIGWVHHSGVNPDAMNRGRGTSSRFAALDTQILVTRKQRFQTILTNTKQRDGEEFSQIAFNLESINTNFVDNYGNQITTLVPILCSDDITTSKKSSLNAIDFSLKKLLKECVAKNGVELNDEIIKDEKPLNGKMVLASIWSDEALKILKSKGDQDEKKQYAAKIKTFNRHKTKLIEKDVIREFGDYVYFV